MFLIALMATTLYAQRAGHRFATNLFNVIQMRMLPDQDAKTYLAHNGLQIGPTLTSAIGKPIWEVTNRDSEMQAAGIWLEHKGRKSMQNSLSATQAPSTALSWLLTDRRTAARSLVLDDIGLPTLFNLHVWQGFYPIQSDIGVRFKPSWFTWLCGMPLTWPGFILMLVVAASYYLAAIVRRRSDPLACLALAIVPALVVSQLADSWDIWRHCLPFVFTALICTILFAARLIDAAAGRVSGLKSRELFTASERLVAAKL